MADLISDEVVMTDAETIQVGASLDQTEVVLYKCEECGNLFSSWELVQSHLDGLNCPGAGRNAVRSQGATIGSDGSVYVFEDTGRSGNDQTYGNALQVLDYVFKPAMPAVKRPLVNPIEPPVKRGPGRPRGRRKKELDPVIFKDPFPGEPTYPCKVCGAVFKSNRGLDEHNVIHQNQNGISCDVCGEKFLSLTDLKCHRELHTGRERDVSLICDVCGEEFTHRGSLRSHVADRHAAELAYICEYCEAAFFTDTELEVHVDKCPERKHLEGGQLIPISGEYTCAICHKTYKTITNLSRHVSKFHKQDNKKSGLKSKAVENQIPCALCYELFEDLEALQGHECMALPSGAEICAYKCGLCETSFVGELFLELHTLNHTGKKSDAQGHDKQMKIDDRKENVEERSVIMKLKDENFIYCKKCGHIFTHLDAMNDHINDIHFGPGRLECEICTRLCGSQVELEQHKMAHDMDDDLPFHCTKCPRRFKRQYQLSTHLKEHNWDTPYECPECGLCYATPEGLNEHEKTDHPQSERPPLYKAGEFPCDVCDKVLKTKDSLQAHFRIHTGDRPFQCEECHQSFKRRSEIQQHQATHTGERKFQCDLCEQNFKYRNNLDTHRRTHGDKNFACEFCPKKFTRKTYLDQHALKEHAAMTVMEVLVDSIDEEALGGNVGGPTPSRTMATSVEVIRAGTADDQHQDEEYTCSIASGDDELDESAPVEEEN